MTNFSDYLTRWKSFNASWVDRPQDWQWRGPRGEHQGIRVGHLGDDDHLTGRANMLWLSMELLAPPRIYDARTNTLYVLLTLHGHKMRLGNMPLFDQAGSLTLGQFRSVCENSRLTGPDNVSNLLPLFKLLASRRLEDAISR